MAGLCIPVIIGPSRLVGRGGGVGKWTSVTPSGRKPIFSHPLASAGIELTSFMCRRIALTNRSLSIRYTLRIKDHVQAEG